MEASLRKHSSFDRKDSKSQKYTPWMPSLQIWFSSCVDPLAKSCHVMASGCFIYIRRPRRPLHTYRDGWRKPQRILYSIMCRTLWGWRNSRWLRPQWQRNKALRPKLARKCVYVCRVKFWRRLGNRLPPCSIESCAIKVGVLKVKVLSVVIVSLFMFDFFF